MQNSFFTHFSRSADGEWHHVVGTVDDGTWKIFVDGVEENSSFITSSGNFDDLDVKFYAGMSFFSHGSTVYEGCMKEMSFWDIAKSDVTIAADYDGYAGYTGSEANLIRYWKMDEGTGTNLDDETANDEDLTPRCRAISEAYRVDRCSPIKARIF